MPPPANSNAAIPAEHEAALGNALCCTKKLNNAARADEQLASIAEDERLKAERQSAAKFRRKWNNKARELKGAFAMYYEGGDPQTGLAKILRGFSKIDGGSDPNVEAAVADLFGGVTPKSGETKVPVGQLARAADQLTGKPQEMMRLIVDLFEREPRVVTETPRPPRTPPKPKPAITLDASKEAIDRTVDKLRKRSATLQKKLSTHGGAGKVKALTSQRLKVAVDELVQANDPRLIRALALLAYLTALVGDHSDVEYLKEEILTVPNPAPSLQQAYQLEFTFERKQDGEAA